MIDTVRLYLETTNAPSALPYLTAVCEITNHDTGELHYYGRLANLKVRVNSDSLSVQGSLPKFHLGSNALTLTHDEIARAIQHLSDALHLPMDSAAVRRLDVAHNLILREPVSVYLSALFDCRYFRRWETDGGRGLQYVNSRRCLALYDKVAELRKSREPLPRAFIHRHVLRYELRFSRGIARQFKQTVTASTLSERPFCLALSQRWLTAYFSIRRVHRPLLQMNASCPKDLLRSLALFGLHKAGGLQALLPRIDAARTKHGLTNTQVCRMRSALRELATAPALTISPDCLEELDHKIRVASRFFP